jgi:uncharacterized coiled-coil DUF342 family protein
LSDRQKIDELTRKLSELKDRRDKLNAEADGWAEKRDKQNEEFRNLRSEIFELRNERDKLNEEVKMSKLQRDDARSEFHAKIEETKKLGQEMEALFKKKPSRSFQSLQQEFEQIEWKIQTTPLGPEEEKELIEQVKQLETQLRIYKKLDQLNQKRIGLKAELDALKTRSKLSHEELTETAKRSQQIHAKMIEKINESKNIKEKADGLHGLFLQTREKIRPVQEEISKISLQIKELEEEAQKEEKKERKKSEEALREKLEKEAREKLQRGEKLTWEEFQLLAKKGTKAQD